MSNPLDEKRQRNHIEFTRLSYHHVSLILIILYLVYNFHSLCELVTSGGSVTAPLQRIL